MQARVIVRRGFSAGQGLRFQAGAEISQEKCDELNDRLGEDKCKKLVDDGFLEVIEPPVDPGTDLGSKWLCQECGGGGDVPAGEAFEHRCPVAQDEPAYAPEASVPVVDSEPSSEAAPSQDEPAAAPEEQPAVSEPAPEAAKADPAPAKGKGKKGR